jgi:uncharacterized protein YdaT
MPWNDERYPPSMRNLPPPVRGKAIEIANALLRQGAHRGQRDPPCDRAGETMGHVHVVFRGRG